MCSYFDSGPNGLQTASASWKKTMLTRALRAFASRFYGGTELELLKEFQIITGVGPSMAQDLIDLGYREVDDLQGENPEEMYHNLISLRREHIDRCVLYVFRCSVYFANNSVHEPELPKWWNWKDRQ